jgi:hypothetical protein
MTEDKFFEGPGGEYLVSKSLTDKDVFEVHDDHAGNLLATTSNRAAAEALATLFAEVRFQIKPMRDSSA